MKGRRRRGPKNLRQSIEESKRNKALSMSRKRRQTNLETERTLSLVKNLHNVVQRTIKNLPNRHHLHVTYNGRPVVNMNRLFTNTNVRFMNLPAITKYFKGTENEEKKVSNIVSKLSNYIIKIRQNEQEVYKPYVKALKTYSNLTNSQKDKKTANNAQKRYDSHQATIRKFQQLSRHFRQQQSLNNDRFGVVHLPTGTKIL